jgi:hypothetical protein
MSSDNQTRLLLRLPSALHKRAKARASETGNSLNSVIVQAIENGLSKGQLEALTPSIIKHAKSQFGDAFLGLLLYGSRARGDAYESSDTDLLLVVDSSVPITRELYRS